MKPNAIEELGVLLLGELGKVYQQVDALPENLREKLSAVELATQSLMQATKEAQNYAGALQQTADKIVASSVETTRAQLVESISQTAKEVAYHTSKKSMLQWAAGGFVAAVVCIVVSGYWMHQTGWEAGYQGGRGDTILSSEYQKNICAWSTTTEGKMAVGLASVGVLRNLYTCDNPGWVIEAHDGGRMCVPKPDSKTKLSWGWQLPPLRSLE